MGAAEGLNFSCPPRPLHCSWSSFPSPGTPDASCRPRKSVSFMQAGGGKSVRTTSRGGTSTASADQRVPCHLLALVAPVVDPHVCGRAHHFRDGILGLELGLDIRLRCIRARDRNGGENAGVRRSTRGTPTTRNTRTGFEVRTFIARGELPVPVSLDANPRLLKAPENPPCFFPSSPGPCEAIECSVFPRGLVSLLDHVYEWVAGVVRTERWFVLPAVELP